MANSTQQNETLKFRYVWPVKVSLKKLNQNEVTVLNVSPKFATVHDHVSFQWSVKLHGTQNLDNDDEDADTNNNSEYVAISIYYVDGPVNSLEMSANVGFLDGPKFLEDHEIAGENIQVFRGHEVELLASVNRAQLSEYVMTNVNKKIKVVVTLEMDAQLFKTETYLNAASPTPFCSFLTANYRARACSKVWKRRSHENYKRPRSHSEGQPNCKKLDLERTFNRIMETENLDTNNDEEVEEVEEEQSGKKPEHLFKKLLVNCCDSCFERRASIIPCASEEEFEEVEDEQRSETPTTQDKKEEDEKEKKNTFECCQEEKTEIHDTLANMFFNKIALPQMEFVEDFADFLIDAELNELPVLKRACERYLCGELNTKRDIQTSLLLDLLFLSMVFDLPVMKSMTLTELCERHNELTNVEQMLEHEEYKKLDNRIRQFSGYRNLGDLIKECQRFRQQRMRVEQIF